MPGTKGKICVVCEKKSVDTSLPQGLTCTYCGAYFHSSCSDTFSAGICKSTPFDAYCLRLCESVYFQRRPFIISWNNSEKSFDS
ncbi:hypothetical protein EMCRGX_G030549 [Ephydatia muelleri]